MNNRRNFFDRGSNEFRNFERWKRAMSNIITSIETGISIQEILDNEYTKFTYMIFFCRNKICLKYTASANHCRKKLRNNKTYWTENLTRL